MRTHDGTRHILEYMEEYDQLYSGQGGQKLASQNPEPRR